MRKTLATLTACALGILGAAALVSPSPAHAQAKPQTVSKGVAKPLKAAQEALQKKSWQEALAKLNEADAVAGKTPFDQFTINEMRGFAYVRTGNYAEAARALEAGLNSGLLDQADVSQRVKALAQVNYQIKNYDKAIEYGNRAVKSGFADAELYTLIGQAYYVKGDYKGTLRFMEDYVGDQIKRGQTPKEQSLQLVMSSCVKLDDTACTTRALEKMVQYYPKPEYWQNIVYSLFRTPDVDDRLMLNTYRLASDVNAIKRGEDYTEMAQLAIEQGSPGEAVAILNKGFEKNVFTEQREKEKNQRLLDSAKKAAAADQASLAKLEADAGKAKTGAAEAGVGKAYLSYGQYDKAAAALQRGLTKGGLSNPEETQILLGIAQLKSGNKAEAVKNFKAIKDDSKYARIANLWALHSQQ